MSELIFSSIVMSAVSMIGITVLLIFVILDSTNKEKFNESDWEFSLVEGCTESVVNELSMEASAERAFNTPVSVGGNCSGGRPCVSGSSCVSNICTKDTGGNNGPDVDDGPVNDNPGEKGDSCGIGYAFCASGLYCNGGTCSSSAGQLAAGDYCGPDTGSCPSGSECSNSSSGGVCRVNSNDKINNGNEEEGDVTGCPDTTNQPAAAGRTYMPSTGQNTPPSGGPALNYDLLNSCARFDTTQGTGGLCAYDETSGSYLGYVTWQGSAAWGSSTWDCIQVLCSPGGGEDKEPEETTAVTGIDGIVNYQCYDRDGRTDPDSIHFDNTLGGILLFTAADGFLQSIILESFTFV